MSTTKIKPLDETTAWGLFDVLRKAGFAGGIHMSIWGSRDGKRWEVRATPTASMLLPDGTPEPDRWEDGTAIWGARR